MLCAEPENRFKVPPRESGVKSDARKLSGLGLCAGAGQRQGCRVNPLAENKADFAEMPGSRVQNKEARSATSDPALSSKYQTEARQEINIDKGEKQHKARWRRPQREHDQEPAPGNPLFKGLGEPSLMDPGVLGVKPPGW